MNVRKKRVAKGKGKYYIRVEQPKHPLQSDWLGELRRKGVGKSGT